MSARRQAGTSEVKPDKKVAEPINRAMVLRIVQTAQICPPLTAFEVAGAARRGAKAGTLLAAAAIHHAMTEGSPPDATGQAKTLEAYFASEAGTKGKEYAGFEALRGEVERLSREFADAYTASGEAGRESLGELFDTTDTMDIPILDAIPRPSSYGRGQESKRNAVAEAGRLLRYMAILDIPPSEPEALSV